MKNRFLKAGVFILLITGIPASGAELTIDTLINEVIEKSPFQERSTASLSAGYEQYLAGISESKLQVNGSLPLYYGSNEEASTLSVSPELQLIRKLPTSGTISGTVSNSLKDVESDSVLYDTGWENTLTAAAALKQPLFFKNGYKEARIQLEKNYYNSRLIFFKEMNNCIIEAVGSYYTLIRMQLRNKLVLSGYNKAEDDYRKTEREYNLGLVTKSLLYQAKAVMVKSRIDLLEAQQDYDTAFTDFTELYGLPENTEIPAAAELFSFRINGLTEYSDHTEQENPDILIIKNRIRMNEASGILFDQSHAPVLSIQGDVSFLNQLPFDDTGSISFSVSAVVDLSAADGGRYEHNRKKVEFENDAMQNELNLTITGVRDQIKKTVNSIKVMIELMELYDIEIEAAEYEAAKGEKDLESGIITKKEYYSLSRNLDNALLNKQENILNINTSFIKLLALSGVYLGDMTFLKERK